MELLSLDDVLALEEALPLPEAEPEFFDDFDAFGVAYLRDEELYCGTKERERDQHRWELDPASAEDYDERARRAPAGYPALRWRHFGH